MGKIDRKPAVAGQFYPAGPEKLHQELTKLFTEAASKKHQHIRAIISPHAGYVFSGKVAASAFNQIDEKKNYKHVFIVASSHQEQFDGAAIYCDGDFLMPYGKERVDTDLGRELVQKFPDIFTANRSPHQREHSLEVQLPFLNFVLKTNYCIVPIILGTSSPAVCKKIANALKPWFNEENLFIISSDFSHYADYTDAKNVDLLTKNAILSNDPEALLTTLSKNTQKHIPHLVTSLCGWTSVLTLMYMTADNDSMKYYAIDYNNSGDSNLYGDLDRVVGYWGIAISEEIDKSEKDEDLFELTDSEKSTLLKLARKTIEDKVNHEKGTTTEPTDLSQNLKTNCGAFVSLHIDGNLRGCIGRLIGDISLYRMIQEMAVSSAIHDSRFFPVMPKELASLNIELSVLSPLKKIENTSEIQLGKHGIYIVKGYNSGVFLPQVATETGWSLEDFLGHCARDKAGLDWEGWKTADIFIFTATVFGEK